MSKTLCFFGATGGCANACMTQALNSGSYKIIALVRTPQKLKDQLKTLQNLDEATINSPNLNIVQGNATSVADVKRALLANVTAGVDTSLPSMVITGLGAAPVFRFDIRRPLHFVDIDNPTLCGTAAKTLVTALTEIYTERQALAANKPALTFISTTGITRGSEDVPFLMRFLYHQLLAAPHVDKRAMEDVFRGNIEEKDSVFASVTGIRPTLLTGTGTLNEGRGLDQIRAGVESKPEMGYTIQRADVGSWIFENVVEEKGAKKWRGEIASLA